MDPKIYEKPESTLEEFPQILATLLGEQRKIVSLLVVLIFPVIFLAVLFSLNALMFSLFVPGFIAGAIVKFTGNIVESKTRKVHGIMLGGLMAAPLLLASDSSGISIVLVFLSNSFFYYMVSERNLSEEQEKAMIEYEKSIKS